MLKPDKELGKHIQLLKNTKLKNDLFQCQFFQFNSVRQLLMLGQPISLAKSFSHRSANDSFTTGAWLHYNYSSHSNTEFFSSIIAKNLVRRLYNISERNLKHILIPLDWLSYQSLLFLNLWEALFVRYRIPILTIYKASYKK